MATGLVWQPWRLLAQDMPWKLACDAGSSTARRRFWRITAHGGRGLYGPQQHVPLPAERELDDTFRREVARREHHLLVRDCDVVDPQSTAFDLSACVALG